MSTLGIKKGVAFMSFDICFVSFREGLRSTPFSKRTTLHSSTIDVHESSQKNLTIVDMNLV